MAKPFNQIFTTTRRSFLIWPEGSTNRDHFTIHRVQGDPHQTLLIYLIHQLMFDLHHLRRRRHQHIESIGIESFRMDSRRCVLRLILMLGSGGGGGVRRMEGGGVRSEEADVKPLEMSLAPGTFSRSRCGTTIEPCEYERTGRMWMGSSSDEEDSLPGSREIADPPNSCMKSVCNLTIRKRSKKENFRGFSEGQGDREIKRGWKIK